MPSRKTRVANLACCAICCFTFVAGKAVSQEAAAPGNYSDDPALAVPAGDAGAAAGSRVVPLTSSFFLNGVSLEYGATGFLSFNAERGGGIRPNGTYALSTDLSEGLNGTLFERTQSGQYVQLWAVDQERIITTTRRGTGNLSGTQFSLTITGGCLGPDAAPDSYCSYTPGVAVDEDDLDPDTLVPRSFIFTSEFGAQISEETHLALAAPGFQRGMTGSDEQVGLDLDLPNAGFSLATGERVIRDELIDTRLIVTLSTIEQHLYSNDEEASLDRTIRGFVLLQPDDWTREAVALQLAGRFMPALSARLDEGSGQPDLRISNNSFYSANNLRLPAGSFAVHQSSISRTAHSDTPPQSATETPVAWSNGFWMGLSPVSTITTSDSLSYTPTGPRETTSSDFSQGGIVGGDVFGGSITIIDAITDQISQIELSNIDDLFVQSGATVTSQDAVRTVTSSETSTFRYVPHLSVSGNRTSGTSVLRYYAGLILGDEANAYVGSDFTLDTETDWSVYLRADFYTEPDRDYFSAVEGRLNRTFALAANRSLILGVAALMELDRPDTSGEVPELGKGANVVDVVAQYEMEATQFSLRHRISDLGAVQESESTTLGLTYSPSPRLGLTMQYTPHSTESSYIEALAGLSWALDDTVTAPVLSVQWARTSYDYGPNEIGEQLTTSDDTLLAALQIRF